MNYLNETLLAILAALGIFTSSLLQRLIDRVEKMHDALMNHVLDEVRHNPKSGSLHRSVCYLFFVCSITSICLFGCLRAKTPTISGSIPATAAQILSAQDITNHQAELIEHQQALASKDVETLAVLRWTSVLLALGVVGMFLPSFLFSRVESIIATGSALSFFLLARWSIMLEGVVKVFVPIVIGALLISVGIRWWLRRKQNKPS